MFNNASARGDLGFIPNQRLRIPSRGFFGTGNPSKKGVAISHAVPKSIAESTRNATNDAIVGKRTDYLEVQERKISATLSDTRSQQNNLVEQLASTLDTMDRMKTDALNLSLLTNSIQEQTKWLHMSQHWVYGHTACAIRGFAIPESESRDSSLASYRERNDTIEVSPKNRWIHLSYPMERVDLTDGTVQLLMPMKHVDPKTAQISFMWVIVYEKDSDDTEKRFVDEFAVTPH